MNSIQTFSYADRMVIAMKLIVMDMDQIRENKEDPNGAMAFFWLGQALAKVYAVFRGLTKDELARVKPVDMIQWVKDQKIDKNLLVQ